MGISPTLLRFGEWAPDISDLNTNVSANILNVVPRADGYGPFNSLLAFTSALSGACRGAFFARNADGSITVFAATATKLYYLNNTTFGWTDVSKGGGSYSSVPGTSNWQFVQYNTKVIAVQVNTAPQVIDLTSLASNFADLGGSPPQAAYVAIINRFVVLAGISGFPYRVQWSGLGAITIWDNVSSQSNLQDLGDGGRTTGIAGGDQFGVIFQESSIRSMIFAPGSPVVFDILRIASNDGLLSPFAAVNAADEIFFCSPQGFKMVAPGGYPEAIGKEKVDRTFFADIDSANLQLLIAATDPTTTRVYWAYKSIAGSANLFDTILVYDRVLKRWGKFLQLGEYLTFLAKPGLTLENLDALAPGIISISGATNNGSGLIRLTISGTSAGTPPSNTDITIQNTVEVYGVNGTTEANGSWQFTIINSTTIDLKNSTFTNAYTSGGSIGGSIDQLSFSLDSVSSASLAQLGGVTSAHALGFFNGATLEGQIETPEQDGNGRRFRVTNVRPMTDCSTVNASIGWRDTQNGSITYTSETQINDIGTCPVAGGGIDVRYAKCKLRMPAGSSWTYAMGIEPEFRMSGWR